MGNLTFEAANLAVRNLGHRARREQGPKSTEEIKDVMQALMYGGKRRNTWDPIREEIGNKT